MLGWLTPDEQLSLLPTLISSAEGGQDRLWLVMSLGHAQVAAGNPAGAAETLAGIVDQLPAGGEQDKAARELVRLYLASGQPVRALDTFQARNLMSPGAAGGLQEAIQLARLAGKDGLERQWLESLMRQYTADITELRRLRALQLGGQGDLAQAAMTAERVAGCRRPWLRIESGPPGYWSGEGSRRKPWPAGSRFIFLPVTPPRQCSAQQRLLRNCFVGLNW